MLFLLIWHLLGKPVNVTSFTSETLFILILIIKVGKFLGQKIPKLQVEIDSIFGYEIEGSIRWISSCEYELVYTKVSDNKLENLIGNKMTIKIVYISNNKMICQSDKKMKMEMIKLNP